MCVPGVDRGAELFFSIKNQRRIKIAGFSQQHTVKHAMCCIALRRIWVCLVALVLLPSRIDSAPGSNDTCTQERISSGVDTAINAFAHEVLPCWQRLQVRLEVFVFASRRPRGVVGTRVSCSPVHPTDVAHRQTRHGHPQYTKCTRSHQMVSRNLCLTGQSHNALP